MSEGFDVVTERVEVPSEVYIEMVTHAVRCRFGFATQGYAHARPTEACGLLTERREVGAKLVESARMELRYHRCRNVAENTRNSYVIDPIDQKRVAEGSGPIVGIVHSHPEGEARPSDMDKEMYVPDGWLYLVVGFSTGQPVVGAFKMVRGHLLTCKLVLV